MLMNDHTQESKVLQEQQNSEKLATFLHNF